MENKRTYEDILKEYGKVRGMWKNAERRAWRCAVRLNELSEEAKNCILGTSERSLEEINTECIRIRRDEASARNKIEWCNTRLKEIKEEMKSTEDGTAEPIEPTPPTENKSKYPWIYREPREPVINIDSDQIPQRQYEKLAYTLLKSVRKAFENPEIQAEFEEWLRVTTAEGKIQIT